MTDLSEIHMAIGSLSAQAESLLREQVEARKRDEKIFSKLEQLSVAQARALQQQTDVEREQKRTDIRLKDVEKHVEDYKNVRRWGAMVWAGTLFMASIFGYAIEQLYEWVRKL